MDFSRKKLIVVVGPTAVGKTVVSIELAKHYKTEIISADSRQIFRELTIGTAKPDEGELAEIKHHFINSHSIENDFNAAQFGEEASELILGLFEKFDHLVVCGGSGLYVKGLLEGFDDIPEISSEIRENLIEQFKRNGLLWLQQQMQTLDPVYFEKIDQQNPVRLMRALEVKIATGISIGEFHVRGKKKNPYQVIKIGLELPREELYKRIDERMDKMIDAGLFQEVEGLVGFQNKNALQTVGYQEIFNFLNGEYDKAEAIRLLKRNSRRYAKRQLTWFKRDAEIMWTSPRDLNRMLSVIESF